MRFLLSVIWYAIQGWYGGQCLKIAIGALWPTFHAIRNTLPHSAGMATNDLIAFGLFNTLTFPLCLVDPKYTKKTIQIRINSHRYRNIQPADLVARQRRWWRTPASTFSRAAWSRSSAQSYLDDVICYKVGR